MIQLLIMSASEANATATDQLMTFGGRAYRLSWSSGLAPKVTSLRARDEGGTHDTTTVRWQTANNRTGVDDKQTRPSSPPETILRCWAARCKSQASTGPVILNLLFAAQCRTVLLHAADDCTVQETYSTAPAPACMPSRTLSQPTAQVPISFPRYCTNFRC